MGTFILILLILFLLMPYLLKFVLRFGANHMAKKFQNYAERAAGTQGTRNERDDEQPKHKRRGKIFKQNDGEYVNFEEIKEERTVEYDDDDTTYVDDRISDVKFEEIKDK